MASKLPCEIWLKIADYLPRTELQGLYALNSAFFNAVMDARYREAEVLMDQFFDVAKVLRKLEQLGQPHVACRVRSIKIDLSYFGTYFDPNTGFYLNPSDYPDGDGILHCLCVQLSIATKMSLRPLLSRITKCELTWQEEPASTLLVPFLWSALGSNLQSLELHSSLEDIHSLLRSAPTHFPALESVHITFSRLFKSSIPDEEIFLTSIIPFLNRHSSTLSSLTVFNRYNPLADVSCLFNTLGYFPWLRHLGFYIGYVSDTHIRMSDPRVLTQFLKSYADQLQSYTIHLVTMLDSPVHHSDLVEYGDISHSLLNVPFPNLLKLEISSYGDTSHLHGRTLDTIHWFPDTLTTLSLRNFPFTLEQAEIFASSFHCRPEDSRLKILSFRVNTISPELIDLLAYRFPGLVRLTLHADALKPQNPNPHSRANRSMFISSEKLELFRVEMEKRVYDKWALCHLDIRSSWGVSFSSVVEIIKKRISKVQEGL